MILVDSYQPGLKDGVYTLTVGQDISAGPLDDLHQKFTVAGPRFAIDPADIHAQFPPPGHTGAFTEVLPHVVLTKRLLPWERSVEALSPTTPWIALLVFEDGELLGTAPQDRSEPMLVSALLAPTDGARVPDIRQDTLSDDEKSMTCRTITLSSATFARLAPTALELPFLAHSRRVDTRDKIALDLKDEGLFSVVVGNRFPAPASPPYGAKTIAHLVSLEGFGDLLTGASPATPPQSTVRMVSLASWTFSCLPDPAQTFSGLARNLAYAADGSLRPAESLRLRAPAGQSTGAAAIRLADGYSAVGYHATTGEDGFAWYRGPIAPVVDAAPLQGPFATAAGAMIYDPALGVFDHSLSAAWRAGQGLALSNRSFATSLVSLRARAARLVGVGRPAVDPTTRQAVLRVLPMVAEALKAASTGARPLLRTARGAPARPGAPLAELKRRLDRDVDLATLDADPDLNAVAGWLAGLQLLKGVPFLHLVPDPRMLPPESIRFGFIAPDWISALLDGAVSLGIATSLDAAVQAKLTAKLKTMAAARAQTDRADQQGQPPPPAAPGPLAAMLIRSALVAGWPGVAVAAAGGGAPMALLRLDAIGPDVLLAIFNGVPDTVTLTKPHEGLEFGVDDTGRVTTREIVNGKIVTVEDVKIYDPQDDAAQTCALRPGGARVLNIRLPGTPAEPADLVGLLAKALGIDPTTIGPALFGLQMMKGSEQIVFAPTPPAPPHQGPTS